VLALGTGRAIAADASVTAIDILLKPDATMRPAGLQVHRTVSEGWPMVVSNLKSLLESGDVALVYHRGHED